MNLLPGRGKAGEGLTTHPVKIPFPPCSPSAREDLRVKDMTLPKERTTVFLSMQQKDFLMKLCESGYAETPSAAIRRLIDDKYREVYRK